jgi:hypothetical protein
MGGILWVTMADVFWGKGTKNKAQGERVEYECNKDRDFSLKKVMLIIEPAYQTVVKVSPFNPEHGDNRWMRSIFIIKGRQCSDYVTLR